jgi:hypothetical protein
MNNLFCKKPLLGLKSPTKVEEWDEACIEVGLPTWKIKTLVKT